MQSKKIYTTLSLTLLASCAQISAMNEIKNKALQLLSENSKTLIPVVTGFGAGTVGFFIGRNTGQKIDPKPLLSCKKCEKNVKKYEKKLADLKTIKEQILEFTGRKVFPTISLENALECVVTNRLLKEREDILKIFINENDDNWPVNLETLDIVDFIKDILKLKYVTLEQHEKFIKDSKTVIEKCRSLKEELSSLKKNKK